MNREDIPAEVFEFADKYLNKFLKKNSVNIKTDEVDEWKMHPDFDFEVHIWNEPGDAAGLCVTIYESYYEGYHECGAWMTNLQNFYRYKSNIQVPTSERED